MTQPTRAPGGSANRSRGIALGFLAACVSGVAVFVNGYGVKRFTDASVYTTAKNGVAALILLVLLASTRPRMQRRGRVPVSRSHVVGLIALGVVGGSVPFVLFFEGLARASSVQAAFIHKTLVFWVALLAVPLLRERIGVSHVAAVALLVWGQATMVKDIGAIRFGSGEWMILGATLLWAVEFVLAKRLLSSLGSLVVGTARMTIGLVCLIAYVVVSGRTGTLVHLTAAQWGWALATGSILGLYVWAWYAALARVQAVDAAAILVFGAVVTALLAQGFQGVSIAPNTRGLALVTAGVFLAAVAAERSRARPEVVSP